MIKVMKKIKIILEKVLNGIDLSLEDYIYLQKHQKEAKETHNLELIELAIATESRYNSPSFRFNKVL